MKDSNIAILGLGWLGKELALNLLAAGYQIKGSVTSQAKVKDLSDLNIKSSIFKLGESLPELLINCGIYIITIPPTNSNYKQNVSGLINQLPSNAKLIYISSSSVYPNTNALVRETDAEDRVSPHSGISLFQVENLFKIASNQSTIIRMAGLYGPGRHPGKFLAGKTDLKGAKSPINLVHLDDCIGIIKTVLSNNYWDDTFNACSDAHPIKKDFYTKATALLKLEPPVFTDKPAPFKIVDNTKSKVVLGYEYQHPDPMKTVELV